MDQHGWGYNSFECARSLFVHDIDDLQLDFIPVNLQSPFQMLI